MNPTTKPAAERDIRYRSLSPDTYGKTSPLAPFSYYGSKSKLSHLYPEPKHRLIIEPFAGSAAYAWRYRKLHQVRISDINDDTIALWEFLHSKDAVQQAERFLPTGTKIAHKQVINTIAPDAPRGLKLFMESELARGAFGRKHTAPKVYTFGIKYYWARLKAKLVMVNTDLLDRPWVVENKPYTEVENVTATWFIDPPYWTPPGRKYRAQAINYQELAEWCRSRLGQVIVCEYEKAEWLDFKPLLHRQVGSLFETDHSPEVKVRRDGRHKEMVWVRG